MPDPTRPSYEWMRYPPQPSLSHGRITNDVPIVDIRLGPVWMAMPLAAAEALIADVEMTVTHLRQVQRGLCERS